MVRFRGLTALACLTQLVTVHGADCLSTVDVIPANQRVDITLNGQSIPIGFSGPDWDSARLYSKIAEIITKEILGFNTQMGPHGDESGTSYMLAAQGSSIHFLSEIWSSFSEDIVVFDANNPDKALPSLKNLDYSGRDGMFIFPKSFQPYYDTYGKSLEFYQYFNVSVLRRNSDFSKIADFDLTMLSACDSGGGAEIEKTYYLQTTGDNDAIVNGAWVCHQQKWWLSPGCRSDPTTCVPLLTHLFWGWSEMRQKAAYFNMPVAMASTTSNEIYKQWPKDNKMLAYWWMPDDRFTSDGAIQMFFPDHNPGLWEVGNKVTMAVAEPLYSYYKPGIDSAAPKVYQLMSSMTLFDDDMIRLLNDVVAARSQGITDYVEHVACNWVQNNGPRWRAWIPIATECTRSLGFGLVTDDGTFVQDRSLATGCSLCTPGRFASTYSDNVGQSAVCIECPNGTAQDRGGQTECVECAAGTYRVPSGIRCSPCKKGTYQPQGAQDSCLSCSSPMTTVTVGSDTQDMCICPAKTYRPCYDVDNNGSLRSECQCDTGFYTQGGRCVGCPDGMVCEEGSDEQFFPCAEVDIVNSTVNPYPKPDEGYFVLLQQPTYVFKCIDLLSCPGGQAENCGAGLRGIACGACDAGYYKPAGSCNQCGEFEQSPLFLIIPALISPAFVFVLYKVSLADVHLWGRTGQGFGGIGYLLLVYAVSQLFDALAESRSTVQWKDFADFFQALEPNLTRQQLEMLWRTFDKDGDGSVSREEFQRALQSGSVKTEEKKAPEICLQLASTIFRQGKTVLALFEALASAEGRVQWTDFQSLFLQLEPSLSASDLESLWKDFDKDGDGSITKEEFFAAMEPSVRLVVAKQAEVIARMALALQRQNQNVDQLFNALATEQGVVSWPDFRSLFQQWEPSLGEDDLQGLWRSFDKDGDGSVTREEFVSALAPATQAAAAHTEDVCKRVASMLFQNGRTVTQLFDALSAGQEQVAFEDFRSLFQQLEPSLTLPDLQALWRCFDKDGDGGVTRQEFLKAMAPSAKLVVQKVTDVCGQVTQLLQQQGKSVEQLFDALAENQVVRWEAFCAFFQGVSSSLSEPDLHGLWHSFDKDGDGTVSREEFVQALGFAAPAAPGVPSGASELTDALWQAIAEVATLRAAAVGPRGSAALQDAIRQQLAAFDITRTGFLDPSTFSKAMRSYSPALPDPVVEVLRGQVCQADGKVQIDQLVTKILQPPEPPAPRASPAPPKPPSEAGGPLWSALRRIRPALHERSLRLPTVFQRWLPAGSTRLSKETLGLGVAGLVGSELSEAQLQALFAAMSKHPDLGTSLEDFLAAFGAASGVGFEVFARELLGRTGRSLLRRAKGSLSGAFHTLDLTGEGEVRIAGFRAALLQFGDLNLSDEQVNATWELAKTIGGYRDDFMDFASFKKIFAAGSVEQSPTAGEKRDPGPTLEESCTHLYRLQRADVLRAAIFSHAPDVYLPFTAIAAALRQAAPELTEAEVAQICRLAPQKGGPLHGEDAFSYSHLLERFESDRKDFHPLNPRERSTAADMCRYMDQRLQALGFPSVSNAFEVEVMRADQFLDQLQLYMPKPIRPEDLKVAENLLRLGRPLSGGGIDVVEFCERFELLARNGAAAGSAPPAPVRPPPIPDSDVSKVLLRERSCCSWCAGLRLPR